MSIEERQQGITHNSLIVENTPNDNRNKINNF